ncbi:MAG TPA: DUF2293 domain-containing protein [Actinomycetota bacterium]|nr:DUF2293 domain-containing protein [Actinomycetota bacterium]
MGGGNRKPLETRVVEAAEAALAEHRYASALDVLGGLGWALAAGIDPWQQGRVPHLQDQLQVSPEKVNEAMAIFEHWARAQGLQPAEAVYVTRTRDRRPLQFTASGDPARETAFRTHWLAPDLSDAQRQRLVEKQAKAPDLVVISALKDWDCAECGSEHFAGNLLTMEDPGPICMECADLGHLSFLPAGDTALTRRAKKASGLSAVVVRWSRSRKRYERQGILVEDSALDQAEESCLADEDLRRRRREREAERRAAGDATFQDNFAARIRELLPGCPPDRAAAIADHAALRGSGRVGRSAAGRALDPEPVLLAVAAAVRHEDTDYDRLLMQGMGRADARAQIRPAVEEILRRWAAPAE